MIVEFIKQKVTVKSVFIAVLLAVISMCFSFHFFIKTEYWQNAFPLPSQDSVEIYYNGTDMNSLSLHNNSSDIIAALFEINSKYKYKNIIKLTVPVFEHKFYFNMESNEGGIFEIVPGKTEFYKSFKIDGVEYIDTVLKNKNLICLFPKNKKINFEIITKQSVKNVEIADYISFPALLLTFIFYISFYLFLQSKIFSSLNFCKIKTFFINHKVESLLFLSFFLFYLLKNLYVSVHLNQFLWRPSSGDTPYVVFQIMNNLPKRFHPYYFLPFYPIFDILLVLTRNLLLTLCLIYSSLAAVSVLFVYKTIELITRKIPLSLLLALIFGVSWVQIKFSMCFDVYIFTGFYLAIILYVTSRAFFKKDYSAKNIFIIVLICALTFGVTVSNIITALIITSPILLINKKTFIKSVFLFMILVALFTQIKAFTCNNDSWHALFYKNAVNEAKTWVKMDFVYNLQKFHNTTLREPLIPQYYSRKIQTAIPAILFDVFLFSIVVLSLFLLSKSNKPKQDKRFYFLLIFALMYNFAANFFWYPVTGFIFALNHFALWFVILGFATDVIIEKFKNKNLRHTLYTILLFFFILFLINNYIENQKLNAEQIKEFPMTYNVLKVKQFR